MFKQLTASRIGYCLDDFGWIVSFELKQLEGKTQFTVIHSGWGKPDEIVQHDSITDEYFIVGQLSQSSREVCWNILLIIIIIIPNTIPLTQSDPKEYT